MAGSARNQDPHGEAYERGLEGRSLSGSLLRAAEKDESILEAWREGKADRPGDQPDSPKTVATGDQEPGGGPAASTGPPAPRGRRGPQGRGARRRSSGSLGIRRAARQASVVNPTGGRLPIGITAGTGAAGLFFGGIAYALLLSVVDYGPSGPLLWLKAKFLNEPAGAPSSSSGSGPSLPPPAASLPKPGSVNVQPPTLGRNPGGSGPATTTPVPFG